MGKVVLWIIISSLAMSGWTQEDESEKAERAEAGRLCKIYTMKVQKYKETMRDDDHARVTLANYERLQTKYCIASAPDQNSTH